MRPKYTEVEKAKVEAKVEAEAKVEVEVEDTTNRWKSFYYLLGIIQSTPECTIHIQSEIVRCPISLCSMIDYIKDFMQEIDIFLSKDDTSISICYARFSPIQKHFIVWNTIHPGFFHYTTKQTFTCYLIGYICTSTCSFNVIENIFCLNNVKDEIVKNNMLCLCVYYDIPFLKTMTNQIIIWLDHV